MINYAVIYNRIDEFLKTREGLSNPKNVQDYSVFVKELTGIFCGAVYENNLTTTDICRYLDLVQPHYLKNINNTGAVSKVCDLINTDVKQHQLYYILEHTLMRYKPASVQVGPGEFFMCFYDAGSVFGIDPKGKFDIIIDGKTIEMKSQGTNKTSESLFDKYAATPELNRLLVIKPVPRSLNPQKRSIYACIDVADWRKAFYHKDTKNGNRTLMFKE